jgi:hypothetical protein
MIFAKHKKKSPAIKETSKNFDKLKEMFEKSELSTKIFKLVEPSKIIISFNDEELYQNTFNREFVVSDWGIFGLFRNTLVD